MLKYISRLRSIRDNVRVCARVRWNPEVPIEGLKEALQLMVEGLPETEVAIRVSCPESFRLIAKVDKRGRYTSLSLIVVQAKRDVSGSLANLASERLLKKVAGCHQVRAAYIL